MRRLARQELQRLLHGTSAERDLLGLLTAARGGLTAWDLAELAGVSRWEVEGIRRTAAGRTIQSRPGLLAPGTRPEVLLLAHEELQAAAGYFGALLAGYRERLHAWAADHRARQWPPETPEYLFGGYFSLLDGLGDLARMTGCALDTARHDRMLALTGGDAAALAEARIVLDRIAAQDDPDLATALTLACHRGYLARRNANIPGDLPAVWVMLGQLPRAAALAASITNQYSNDRTQAEVAMALADSGLYQEAELALPARSPTRRNRRVP